MRRTRCWVWRAGVAGLPLVTAVCGGADGPEVVESMCELRSLPFSGSADAPQLTDVGLEIQPSGIVPVATATDPQGFANVDGVVQIVGVYPDDRCVGPPVEVQDDLAGLGLEETFGTAVPSSDTAVYGAIQAATVGWPVHVRFSDADGNVTEGDVTARLIR